VAAANASDEVLVTATTPGATPGSRPRQPFLGPQAGRGGVGRSAYDLAYFDRRGPTTRYGYQPATLDRFVAALFALRRGALPVTIHRATDRAQRSSDTDRLRY